MIVRAEALWEELGGQLCICQGVDVPHWCESCQRRIQLIEEALQITAAPALYEALTLAVEIIHTWHSIHDANDDAWDIYRQHAPEMKAINAALAKYESLAGVSPAPEPPQ